MTNLTYDNAVSELLKEIPELQAHHPFNEDELRWETIVFDAFGTFLLDQILASQPSKSLIQRSFRFINSMMDSEDPRVRNLPQVGVLEVLAGSKRGLEVGYKLLNGRGREWLNKISQNFDAV
jgi:hypothetical protein